MRSTSTLTGKSLLRYVALNGDAVLFRVRSGELRHVFQQSAQIDFLQVKIAGSREVHQRLHNAIQAPNLAVDDIHVAPRIRFLVGQLVPQKLQVKDDGVNRILYLMGNAAGQASAGGKPA